jgi:hypothetical protein
MDVCRVEYCGKQSNLDGLCVFHRRKDIADGLEYDGDKIWDLCSKGHRWTPENTRIESNADGSKRRRCRTCLADKARLKKDEDPVVHVPQPVRLENPVHRSAFESFDNAQEHIDGKCKANPGPYADYDGDHIPNDVEAAKLCSGCPMLAACANTAAATRPGWGVWGAQAWVYGDPWDGDNTRLDEDD